jgi:lipid II:glycine glycyltransferase (peptidoglycan interpeptide bridge formation enzyme)
LSDRGDFQVSEITDQQRWTELLLAFDYPHPMQTWQWGEASALAGGVVSRWSVMKKERCALLAQCFNRRIKGIPLQLAWVPRGPVYANTADVCSALAKLGKVLRARGFRVLVVQPYSPHSPSTFLREVPFREREFTFVVHLPTLSDKVGRLLRTKGINRFEREGGTIVECTGEDAVDTLVRLYARLAERKDFRQYGGEQLIRNIWKTYSKSDDPRLSAEIFQAEVGSQIASSCMVLRVNRTAHFMWAAADYEMRKVRSGEAMQWHLMQTLRSKGVELYDLEGADQKRNPGVYEFKAKLGGVLVERAPAGFKVL